MYKRLAADRRSLTLALASGVGIGFGGQAAYQAWLAEQGPQTPTVPSPDAIARQRAAIQRLQTLFAHQPNAGLRGAITVEPD